MVRYFMKGAIERSELLFNSELTNIHEIINNVVVGDLEYYFDGFESDNVGR
jgi:hypothetical protein